MRFSSSARRAARVVHLEHNDVLVPSLCKYVYDISFIDELWMDTWIYFPQKKYEVFDIFKGFKTLVESKIENKIKVIMVESFVRRDLKCPIRSVV